MFLEIPGFTENQRYWQLLHISINIKEEVDVDGQEGLTMTPDETSQTIKFADGTKKSVKVIR